MASDEYVATLEARNRYLEQLFKEQQGLFAVDAPDALAQSDWRAIVGTFRNDSFYESAMRSGQKWRRSEYDEVPVKSSRRRKEPQEELPLGSVAQKQVAREGVIPYLDVARKVLASDGILTGAQIWDNAERHPEVCDRMIRPFRRPKQPHVALAFSLANDIKKEKQDVTYVSDFHRSSGNPARYSLKTIRQLEGVLDDQAAVLEKLGAEALLEQMQKTSGRPVARRTVAGLQVYSRDPHVVAYVRLRAQYKCEQCGEVGFAKDNGTPYVEVHHLIPLSEGGDDTIENAAALCATCHRRLHFGRDRKQRLAELRLRFAGGC